MVHGPIRVTLLRFGRDLLGDSNGEGIRFATPLGIYPAPIGVLGCPWGYSARNGLADRGADGDRRRPSNLLRDLSDGEAGSLDKPWRGFGPCSALVWLFAGVDGS